MKSKDEQFLKIMLDTYPTIPELRYKNNFNQSMIDSFLDFPTTYEAHPTKISYTIRYGYNVTCTGTGKYTVTYDCDIPEILQGISSDHPLYAQDFEVVTLVNNSFLSWNISGDDETTFELGISATVVAESFLVSDLNGADAVAVQEISTLYSIIANKYFQEQQYTTKAKTR